MTVLTEKDVNLVNAISLVCEMSKFLYFWLEGWVLPPFIGPPTRDQQKEEQFTPGVSNKASEKEGTFW